MPVNVTNTQTPIPNIFLNINNIIRNDAHDAIGALQYTDLFRAAGTLTQSNTIRIDMQGHFQRNGLEWSNIQAQVNGINGNSTVAHIEVSNAGANINDPTNQCGFANRVRSALEQSLDNGTTFQVTGMYP